jgi:lipoyl(octanoyl) transferase
MGTPSGTKLIRQDGRAALWALSHGLVPYSAAVAAMEARVENIAQGLEDEMVWLLEHPALYTAGVSAREEDLLEPGRLPVFKSGRGGQFTYHGPGQRVAYVMLDLRQRGGDVRAFVAGLERWIIAALARLGVSASARAGRVGVWTMAPGGDEKKIAAIGVRLRRWVSFHGVSLNVDPDLSHFNGIVPCGLAGFGVTSLCDLGHQASMRETDVALKSAFCEVFGPVAIGRSPAVAAATQDSATIV